MKKDDDKKKAEDLKKQEVEDEEKGMTRAEAVKLVKREVVVLDEKGKPKLDKNDEAMTKMVDIRESEVLDYKDYGDYVVVVTKDGQKFSNKKD